VEASAFEDNEQASSEGFRQGLARNEFAIHWEAHGHCNALPRAIDEDIRAGRTVVANVSRTVVDVMRRTYADVTVVSITAPPEILAERLVARARNSDGQIERRLSRTVDDAVVAPDVMIVNVGSVTDRTREFVRIIRGD
jgi:ribose 1,5-bisphosphokinase